MALNAVSLYDPTRENSVWSAPQSATNAKLKIILPLNMARAQRKPFSILFSTNILEDVEKPRGGCIFLRKNVVK